MREIIRLLDRAYSCLKSADSNNNFTWDIDYHYNQAREYLMELAKVNKMLGYPAKDKYFKNKKIRSNYER